MPPKERLQFPSVSGFVICINVALSSVSLLLAVCHLPSCLGTFCIRQLVLSPHPTPFFCFFQCFYVLFWLFLVLIVGFLLGLQRTGSFSGSNLLWDSGQISWVLWSSFFYPWIDKTDLPFAEHRIWDEDRPLRAASLQPWLKARSV
jgi:hypothetical protein